MQFKSINDVVKYLLQVEGLKKQVNRAQMLEIVSKLAKGLYNSWCSPDGDIANILFLHGQKLAEKEEKEMAKAKTKETKPVKKGKK